MFPGPTQLSVACSTVNVPRPHPAFRRLQYGKALPYCKWWKAGRGLGTRLGQTLTGRRECGEIPIRLSCCILSSGAPNKCSETQDLRWSTTLCKQHANKGNCTPHSLLSQLTYQEILRHESMKGIWPDSLTHESLPRESSPTSAPTVRTMTSI